MELNNIDIRTLKNDYYGENHIDGSSLYNLIYDQIKGDIDSLIQKRLSKLEDKLNKQQEHIDKIYDLIKQLNSTYGTELDKDLEDIKNNIEQMKSQVYNPSFVRLIMNSNLEKTIDNNTIWINDQGELKIKVNNEIKKLA